MLAGAAAMLPLAARAGQVDTLCITCIDYRFVNKDVTWLNTELGLDFDNWDVVALAGASLAAIPTRVPQNPAAFWDQIKIAKDLHKIKSIILLDHIDCGAYRVAYGKPPPPAEPVLPEDEEWAKHREVLPQVAGMLRRDYGFTVSSWVMPLEGRPINVPG
jgi:carbonic anhydrase